MSEMGIKLLMANLQAFSPSSNSPFVDISVLSLLIARVKFEPESSSSHEPSSSQDPSFYFSILFLLFISSGCYFRLHNDMLVANRKNYNCLVCNILRYHRSLEPFTVMIRCPVCCKKIYRTPQCS